VTKIYLRQKVRCKFNLVLKFSPYDATVLHFNFFLTELSQDCLNPISKDISSKFTNLGQ